MLTFFKSFQDSESRQQNRSEIAYPKIANTYKKLLPVSVEQKSLYEPTSRNCEGIFSSTHKFYYSL